jgi:predicted XRE-type DNA-binding protein
MLTWIMEKTILFKTVIEVIGKPVEHVEKAMQGYLEKIEKDERFEVVHKDVAEVKKREDNPYFGTFAELDIRTENPTQITEFCFEYMPSVIEVIEPQILTLSDQALSAFFTDLQVRLHHVDLVAKNSDLEKNTLKNNTELLLQNYLKLLLQQRGFGATELSKLTGVQQDHLEDFLDSMIDTKQIDLKEGVYTIKNG